MKILIIKIGHSETLDAEISRKTSLGDVLRTTVLLHFFKNDEVTWLVDEKAFPLLEGNPYIQRILIYDLSSVLQLESEEFDWVINLEKVPGICALAGRINAWKRSGFRFDAKEGIAKAYDGAEDTLSFCLNADKKRKGDVYWQEALVKMIGDQWRGEEYILGYRPKSFLRYDVGLNYKVGSKWPNKAWPMSYWGKFKDLLRLKLYSYSWQKGDQDIKEYIGWINSCRLIVTNDSLGLHIALALGKQTVALCGPSAASEIYMYGRGAIVLPEGDYDCLPCLSPVCAKETPCMHAISPEKIFEIIKPMLKEVV